MSGKTKLLNKLAHFQSDANWTLDEVETLLTYLGFNKRAGKGSHSVWTHQKYDAPIVIAAHGNKIKTGYIRAIREAASHL